jgi:ATP adenylyltransferase
LFSNAVAAYTVAALWRSIVPQLLFSASVNHDQLWAPWRIGYITGEKSAVTSAQPQPDLPWEPGADRHCFICRAVAEESSETDRENLVVCRTADAIAILNRYPYNNGHLLVAPRLHKARLDELTDGEHRSVMHLISQSCAALERTMKAEGFNIGLNLGRVAGAGLPGHLHWHIVPRWNGDTNFMPVLAGVDVIPQALEAAFEVLHVAMRSAP